MNTSQIEKNLNGHLQSGAFFNEDTPASKFFLEITIPLLEDIEDSSIHFSKSFFIVYMLHW